MGIRSLKDIIPVLDQQKRQKNINLPSHCTHEEWNMTPTNIRHQSTGGKMRAKNKYPQVRKLKVRGIETKTKQKDMLNRTKTTARRDRVKLQLAESFFKKNWTNKRWLWIWTTGQQRRQRSHALFYPSGLLSHFGFKYKRMIQTDNAAMLAAVLNFGSISVYTHVCRGGQDANTRFWGNYTFRTFAGVLADFWSPSQ